MSVGSPRLADSLRPHRHVDRLLRDRPSRVWLQSVGFAAILASIPFLVSQMRPYGTSEALPGWAASLITNISDFRLAAPVSDILTYQLAFTSGLVMVIIWVNQSKLEEVGHIVETRHLSEFLYVVHLLTMVVSIQTVIAAVRGSDESMMLLILATGVTSVVGAFAATMFRRPLDEVRNFLAVRHRELGQERKLIEKGLDGPWAKKLIGSPRLRIAYPILLLIGEALIFLAIYLLLRPHMTDVADESRLYLIFCVGSVILQGLLMLDHYFRKAKRTRVYVFIVITVLTAFLFINFASLVVSGGMSRYAAFLLIVLVLPIVVGQIPQYGLATFGQVVRYVRVTKLYELADAQLGELAQMGVETSETT